MFQQHQCQVSGQNLLRAHCNTNYLFMKRPCCRSGFMAAVRAVSLPSWDAAHLGPLPSTQSIALGSFPSAGKVQNSRRISPVLSADFFFPRITENVKPPPASSDSSLRASGSRQVLVLPRTLLFLSMPNICGIVVSVRVCVHAYIYIYICINTRVY